MACDSTVDCAAARWMAAGSGSALAWDGAEDLQAALERWLGLPD